ncbi:MAG: glycosyltransferase family 2 protein [Ruminococcaceae bacterium]|nr:glycosyltransferase family 2 protein [Oscillospiraceae bacterium]
MLISIIVPVYNVEKYLDECIASAVNQTYKNIEIVLVDDGSPDKSGWICEEWAKKDDRIKVFHKANGGLSDARNFGIEKSSGDILCFLDSDDYIAPTLCESVAKAFSQNDTEIVAFEINRIFEGKVFGTISNSCSGIIETKKAVSLLLSDGIRNYVCSKAFKKHLFDEIRFPTGHNYEDLGIMHKLFMCAKNVFSLNEKLYFYRKRSTSILGQMSNNTLRDLFIMHQRRYNDIKNVYPDLVESYNETVCMAALAFYDRSLWSKVDENELANAVNYLAQNKKDVSKTTKNRRLKLYYASPVIYNLYRKLKHTAKIILKGK